MFSYPSTFGGMAVAGICVYLVISQILDLLQTNQVATLLSFAVLLLVFSTFDQESANRFGMMIYGRCLRMLSVPLGLEVLTPVTNQLRSVLACYENNSDGGVVLRLAQLYRFITSFVLYSVTAMVAILHSCISALLDHCFANQSPTKDLPRGLSPYRSNSLDERSSNHSEDGGRPISRGSNCESHGQKVVTTGNEPKRFEGPEFSLRPKRASTISFATVPDEYRISRSSLQSSDIYSHTKSIPYKDQINDHLRLSNLLDPGSKNRLRASRSEGAMIRQERLKRFSSAKQLRNSAEAAASTNNRRLSDLVPLNTTGGSIRVDKALDSLSIADVHSLKRSSNTRHTGQASVPSHGQSKDASTPTVRAFLPSERLSVPSPLNRSTHRSDLQKTWRNSIVQENLSIRQMDLQTNQKTDSGCAQLDDRNEVPTASVNREDAHRAILRRMQSKVRS